MSDLNFDENTVNKLKDMMNKGELNDIISKIPPEMMQNFSSVMSNSNTTNDNSNPKSENSTNEQSETNSGNNTTNGFNLNNIDMNTIMKMQSIMGNLNNSNDPRSNLLSSLKPYLREGKKGKLDQYANLMNITKMAGLFKNDNKEKNSKNE